MSPKSHDFGYTGGVGATYGFMMDEPTGWDSDSVIQLFELMAR